MTLLFSIAIFLGAALLFLVQPMVGKMILPRLGGTPMVWNTCLVFFQGALLVGYLYAHMVDRLKNRAAQVAIHFVVLLLPALTLPIVLPAGWQPAAEESQSLAVLRILTVVVALPFCVVSTTGPLLQRWYSLTGAKSAKDPYFLYASSNAGSLLGLLCYPILVEPLVTLGDQAKLWTFGYAAYALLTAVCGVAVLKSKGAPEPVSSGAGTAGTVGQPAVDVTWPKRAKWLVLAMVPSSLCVGATQYISTDVAAIPFLWVLPLSLYLVTFIIAFSRWRVPVLVSGAGLLLCAIGAGLVQLVVAYQPIWMILTLHLGVLFFGALVCHTQLAAMRPDARHLTQYFLLISLGGVLGGSFNALLAPVIFDSLWEYPIAIIAACALIEVPRGKPGPRQPKVEAGRRGTRPAAGAAPAGPGPAEGLESYSRGMIRMGLVMLTLVAGGLLVWKIVERDFKGVLHRERTFFGTHAVETTSEGTWHTLRHGTTRHGVQRMDPEIEQLEPRAYFHRRSPIGSMFMVAHDDAFFAKLSAARWEHDKTVLKRPSFKKVGIVGMGAGTLLAYAQPGDEYTVYEIDPAVDRIARNPAWFTYVSKCKAPVKTIIGDGRLKLAETPDGAFDLLILDAFSSDAVPYHLLTREALELYLKKVTPGGLVALQISNLHVDLGPVIGAAARDLNAAAIIWVSGAGPDDWRRAITGSVWCMVAAKEEDLVVFNFGPGTWVPLVAPSGYRAWTDDYSNLIRALKNPGN